jgi:multiple sugar transport system ATP-binding protein
MSEQSSLVLGSGDRSVEAANQRGKAITLDRVTKIYEPRGRSRPGDPAVRDVSLEIEPGEFLVLVGPSGCGKTTLLRMIAGLEVVTEGAIAIGDVDVTDLHPRHRDIAMVFQNYALYPHMTVAQNLAYALKMRKVRKSEIAARVQTVADMLGLDDLLSRRPAALSGGQRQRVAMGRAIVREPAAFLMDEPLSNLDAKLRVEMRAQLARLHNRLGTTTVYVTHDQVEAMTLGDRVAVMNAGRIQQVARPDRLYNTPNSVFVAAFIGSPSMNLVEATVGHAGVSFAGYSYPADGRRDQQRLAPGERVILGIRPEHFEDARFADPALPTMEVIPAVVEETGSEKHVIFKLDAPPVRIDDVRATREEEESNLLADEPELFFTACVSARSDVREGRPVKLALDSNRFHFFDPSSGIAI